MSTTPSSDTRQRLIAAMVEALSTRGLHGVGLTELLQAAGAPKGVLYHHFPGGKTELAIAAIDDVVERMLHRLDALLARHPNPRDATQRWVRGASAHLQDSAYARGCPLATVALESTPQDLALRAALARAFEHLRSRLAQALTQAGTPAARAEGLAALIVAAYEGGLLQARVAGNVTPMVQATDALLRLLDD